MNFGGYDLKERSVEDRGYVSLYKSSVGQQVNMILQYDGESDILLVWNNPHEAVDELHRLLMEARKIRNGRA